MRIPSELARNAASALLCWQGCCPYHDSRCDQLHKFGPTNMGDFVVELMPVCAAHGRGTSCATCGRATTPARDPPRGCEFRHPGRACGQRPEAQTVHDRSTTNRVMAAEQARHVGLARGKALTRQCQIYVNSLTIRPRSAAHRGICGLRPRRTRHGCRDRIGVTPTGARGPSSPTPAEARHHREVDIMDGASQAASPALRRATPIVVPSQDTFSRRSTLAVQAVQ